MSPQLEAASEIAAFMAARDWRFCLIGGLAVQQWGEPRTTLDADFTLLVGWGNEAAYIAALLAHFEARREDAESFAFQNRVLLIRASNGVSVDVSLGAIDFEEEMIARAEIATFDGGLHLKCCSAEDLFIMKAFASRPVDWKDAETIVARQKSLDSLYILRHLEILCELKETPESLVRAKSLLKAIP